DPVCLRPRTPASQAGNAGSNPVGAATRRPPPPGGGLPVCEDSCGSERGGSSQRLGPCGEQLPLGLVLGQLGGAGELGASLVEPSRPLQQVPPHGGQQVTVTEQRLCG